MKIGRSGAIARENQRVLATVGNFSIEDMQGQMSYDIGGLVQRTYTLPSPSVLVALEAEGARSAPVRRLYLEDLMRMDNVDQTLLRLNEEWMKMTMDGGSVLKIIPTDQMELIFDSEPKLETQKSEVGGRLKMPAYVFFSEGTITAPTAVNEIYSVARQLIARFTVPDGKPIQTFDVFGNAMEIPAPEPHLVEDVNRVMSSLTGKIRSSLSGESLKERIYSTTAAQLFAAQRVQFYRRLYESANLDKLTEAGTRLVYMKLFTEALVDLASVLESKYAFQGGRIQSIRTLERMQRNFVAVTMVDSWLDQFFEVLPHISYMRTAGAQQRWVLSGTPSYQRIMYGKSGDSFRGGVLGNATTQAIPGLDLGGYDVDMYLPFALGDRNTPGDYRTTRDPTQTVLGLRLPIIAKDRGLYVPGGPMYQQFEEIAHVTVDYLSPRVYSDKVGETDSKGRPKSPVRILGVELDNRHVDFTVFPINAATSKLGGVLQGYGIERGHSVVLAHLDSTGVTEENAAFSASSDLAEHMSYKPAAEVTGLVMPWSIR